jgi:hypothetical protein
MISPCKSSVSCREFFIEFFGAVLREIPVDEHLEKTLMECADNFGVPWMDPGPPPSLADLNRPAAEAATAPRAHARSGAAKRLPRQMANLRRVSA